MLYLGIDQHRKQLTVCVRNEEGEAWRRADRGRRGGDSQPAASERQGGRAGDDHLAHGQIRPGLLERQPGMDPADARSRHRAAFGRALGSGSAQGRREEPGKKRPLRHFEWVRTRREGSMRFSRHSSGVQWHERRLPLPSASAAVGDATTARRCRHGQEKRRTTGG